LDLAALIVWSLASGVQVEAGWLVLSVLALKADRDELVDREVACAVYQGKSRPFF
jgi:hypothetical protein